METQFALTSFQAYDRVYNHSAAGLVVVLLAEVDVIKFHVRDHEAFNLARPVGFTQNSSMSPGLCV